MSVRSQKIFTCAPSRCGTVDILPTAALLGSVGQCPCSRGRLSGNAHARVDFCLCHRGQCPCSHGVRGGSLPRECPCSRRGRGVGRGALGTPVVRAMPMLVVIWATNLSAGWGRTLLSPPKVEPPPHLAGESLENPEDDSSEKSLSVRSQKIFTCVRSRPSDRRDSANCRIARIRSQKIFTCVRSRCRIVGILPTAALLGSVGQCPCSRGHLSSNAHRHVDFCFCYSDQCPCSHGGRGGSLP